MSTQAATELSMPSIGHLRRTVMVLCAYLWLLAVLPLWAERDPPLRWHANNGIRLMVVQVVLWMAYNGLTHLAMIVITPLGFGLGLLSPLVGVSMLGVSVVAAIKGIRGRRLAIPFVSPSLPRAAAVDQ